MNSLPHAWHSSGMAGSAEGKLESKGERQKSGLAVCTTSDMDWTFPMHTQACDHIGEGVNHWKQ
ncbi:MAG: hypothetical protein NVS1B11_00230 [Terriglobales bacterium]